MLALRDYQQGALDAIATSDARRQLVALPTGTGKTVVFSELIRRRGGTALVLAHRDELLNQAATKLRTVAPELAMSIGVVQASRNDVGAPIVLASVQTLASRRRLQQLPARFDTVVVDEAHHATAPSYGRVFDHVADSPLLAGFTATPERADKKSDLRNVFDQLVYARSLEEMIRAGYLCDLRAMRITLDQLDLAAVKKSRGDYQANALGEALEAADAIDHATSAYLEHASDRRGIAFFPTVDLSRQAAAAFTTAGIRAAHIDGETPRPERRDTLRALTAGDVQVVCNVGVLTEGFDEPSLECVLVAAPTRSRIRYAQMVGRGTRLYPGKTDCLILDLAGVTDDLSLQSVGVLFGLHKPPKPGETATAAKDREAKADEATKQRRAARRVTRPPATRSRPVALFNRDAIAWTRVGERWIVGLKQDDHLVLDPHDNAWRVLIMGKTRARVAARNLDLGYAMGAAETIIRDAGVIGLADREAPWRQRDASPGQLRYLRKLGTRPPDDCTAGQAADLITTALAAERLTRFDRATATRAA